ncbi:beta-aspartate methyltransferase [Cloacibacillus porcorum]|uniref:Beta-aspartate methyltransferase n=2 Tax=Cloacibacillus porcorum TaxID=1197717 RepID=A0A1B2I8H3_9BACT|nr:beta-aspartate methyltransferase [Cloacibacillus porcorum]
MTYKILHYINQFFAGVGGEDAADYEPEIKKGAVGPGLQLNNLFHGEAEVVATFICGDNYFATHTGQVLEMFDGALEEFQPDIVIAGPSFYAGRYGLACGNVIKEAAKVLCIPGIAGMNVESPAVEMFRSDVFIIKTGDSARDMKNALEKMTRLARKLLNKEPINGADENGYFHRGFRKNFRLEECGGKRAVDMLLKKMAGEEFISEYIQPIPEKVDPAPCIKDMSKATVALLTTGGMVPAGNPDRIEGSAATKFGVYSMEGLNALEKGKVVSVHGGYDTSFAYEDPNRIVPLDVLRELETNGEIGSVHEFFYSTSGTGASLLNGEAFGRSIAEKLNKAGVDAAIMVST